MKKHLITAQEAKCFLYKGSCKWILQRQLKHLLDLRDFYQKVVKTSVLFLLSFQNVSKDQSETNKAIGKFVVKALTAIPLFHLFIYLFLKSTCCRDLLLKLEYKEIQFHNFRCRELSLQGTINEVNLCIVYYWNQTEFMIICIYWFLFLFLFLVDSAFSM